MTSDAYALFTYLLVINYGDSFIDENGLLKVYVWFTQCSIMQFASIWGIFFKIQSLLKVQLMKRLCVHLPHLSLWNQSKKQMKVSE